MPFDAFVLNAVADEITNKLINSGQRVNKIYQINKELIITFRGENYSPSLYFSVHPQRYRIHFTRRHYAHRPFTPTLHAAAQTPLKRSSNIWNNRRWKEFFTCIFLPRTEGKEVIKTLVLETMGRHSNLILLDTVSGEIQEPFRGFETGSPSINRRRTILPHYNYTPPPLQDKLHPFALSYDAFIEEISRFEGQQAESVLIKSIQGISPFLSREIIARAGVSLVSKESARRIWNALEELIQIYSSGFWEPTLLCDNEGNPADFSAFKPLQSFNGHFRFVPSISSLLDEFYAYREKKEGEKNLRSILNHHVDQALKKSRRKEKVQSEELEEAKKADRFKLLGDLIILNLKTIPQKTMEIYLDNLYSPGREKIKVNLDPQLSPALNAQRIFLKNTVKRAREKNKSPQGWHKHARRSLILKVYVSPWKKLICQHCRKLKKNLKKPVFFQPGKNILSRKKPAILILLNIMPRREKKF